MLHKEDFAVIKALHQHGVFQKDIATQLGIHPKTVSRALRRGSAPQGQRRARGSKLDPFKAAVDQLLSTGVWNTVVILREIQAQGYTGSKTILREYIHPKRTLRASRVTVRFETEPGQQLQSDWSEVKSQVGSETVKVHFIVNQLGYSRRFHFGCTDRADAEHTYEGRVRSFEYFGGVTREVLVDNQKAAVLHPRVGDQPTRFNERFVDLADHYGFTPRACRPYRARTKGKTERIVGYIQQHFFVRYQAFESWAHLNQLAESWLAAEADQRRQGTVGEVVADRFTREQPTLNPLPAQRYDTAYQQTRHVSWDGYVEVRGNRYSVPTQFAGQPVAIRIGLDESLQIYAEGQPVASHRLQSARQGWVTVPEHQAELWATTLGVQRRTLEVYEEAAIWS